MENLNSHLKSTHLLQDPNKEIYTPTSKKILSFQDSIVFYKKKRDLNRAELNIIFTPEKIKTFLALSKKLRHKMLKELIKEQEKDPFPRIADPA